MGSFLNVCIYRIPRGASVSFPPSHCPNCKEPIKWYDNIPVFSYLLLRGRCRVCKTKISFVYPVIELVTGILYLLIYFKYGFTILTVKYIIFVSILIVLGMIDLQTYYLPEKLTFSLIFLGFALSFISDITILQSFIGAATYLFPFFMLYAYGESILHKSILGFGDLELVAGIGAFIGYRGYFELHLYFTISFVIGAIVSVILLIKKKKGRKDMIPFGPFLVIAAIIMILK